jgi:hypothetical protein
VDAMATARCLGCKEELGSGAYIQVAAGLMHAECFVCPCCGKNLANAKGYLPYKVCHTDRHTHTHARTRTATPLNCGPGQHGVQRGMPRSGGAGTVAAAADEQALAASAGWHHHVGVVIMSACEGVARCDGCTRTNL